MKLFNFACFHAKEGQEEAVAALLRAQIEPVRAEPGCVEMDAYRSTRNRRLFYIHSRWAGEDAFEVHAKLPGTDRFIQRIQALIDHEFQATRTVSLSALAADVLNL